MFGCNKAIEQNKRSDSERSHRFRGASWSVLQAARGPAPNLAEAIAGEPIRGSWWGHGAESD